MEKTNERKEDVIKTDGEHIYDQIEGQWYRCRDCRIKVSRQEIDRHHHINQCRGNRR